MTVILRGLNNFTYRGMSLPTGALSDVNNDTTTHGQLSFQQRASLAESTITRYNNNNSNDIHVYKSRDMNVETKLHSDTGLQYPYGASVDF